MCTVVLYTSDYSCTCIRVEPLIKDASSRSQVNKHFYPLKRGHLSNEDTFLDPSGVSVKELGSNVS